MEYARQFTVAEPGGAAQSVESSAAFKPVLRFLLSPALALERELQQQLFQSEDAKEGMDAYVNKRKPQFKGNK